MIDAVPIGELVRRQLVSTWMDRLNAELGDVRAAVEKLSLIARNGLAA